MEEKRRSQVVTVDYPKEGERITSTRYTFRIGTPPDVEAVEVSVDNSPWQLCRHAMGYWWYDWSDYTPGRHEVAARSRNREGGETRLPPRRFEVELGKAKSEAMGAKRAQKPSAYRPAPKKRL